MPELPEVETMRRGMLPVLGATLVDVVRPACRLHPIRISPALPTLRRRAVGARIVQLDRRGKRLLVWLDTDEALVFEPRMTGLVLLSDPPSLEHLRLRVDLEGTTVPHFWFWDRRGLGGVMLWNRHTVQRQLAPPHLGPDALELDADRLRERLESGGRPSRWRCSISRRWRASAISMPRRFCMKRGSTRAFAVIICRAANGNVWPTACCMCCGRRFGTRDRRYPMVPIEPR